ncbi:radical SAM protein [Halobacteriovorax sp. XZX-3]|uniref:radical SAM protein n=1 Tax=unclassified Halobacteriovorax TaxID=2639665 RepID=UPI003723A8CD
MQYNKFVEFIELSLNNSCNLQCQGCPSLNPGHKNRRELDFSKVLPIIKKFNPKEVFVCGNDGEPLEHSDINNILISLGENFSQDILIATNGENLLSLDVDKLKKYKNMVFQVAIDGPRQEIHELTRCGSSFTKVLSNIEQTKNFLNIEPIFSRHELNEEYAIETAELINKKFGLDLLFRDTTLVTRKIKPPRKRSVKGNMDFLYDKKYSKPVVPWFKRIYINSDGSCYPCVSFIYTSTEVKPVNIYSYESTFEFFSDFIKFSKEFCNCYQALGNTTQCKLNCDFYMNDFEYDDLESIKDIS